MPARSSWPRWPGSTETKASEITMQRLRDQKNSSDPLIALAAQLVAARDPLAFSEARKRRIREAIDEADAPRPVLRLWRPALVALLLLAMSAIAAAGAIAHRWFLRPRSSLEQPVIPIERAIVSAPEKVTPPEP